MELRRFHFDKAIHSLRLTPSSLGPKNVMQLCLKNCDDDIHMSPEQFSREINVAWKLFSTIFL